MGRSVQLPARVELEFLALLGGEAAGAFLRAEEHGFKSV